MRSNNSVGRTLPFSGVNVDITSIISVVYNLVVWLY